VLCLGGSTGHPCILSVQQTATLPRR
jgi:hypothetical protein